MAYQKTTNLGGDKIINFYYKTDDVFNEASEITAFKGASLRKADGMAEFDRIAISEDERVHLKNHIKKGVIEIFAVLFKILDPTNTSIFFDEEMTVGAATFNAYGGSIVDNENRYRDINLAVIDSKISDALVDFVLERWYWLKNQADDAAAHMARFKQLMVQINDLSLNLRLRKTS